MKQLKGLVLRLQYLIWALSRRKDIHLMDITIYNGVEHLIINGAGRPYWKVMSLEESNLKRKKRKTFHLLEENIVLKKGLKRNIQVIKQDYNFQMGYWYRIDLNKKGWGMSLKYNG